MSILYALLYLSSAKTPSIQESLSKEISHTDDSVRSFSEQLINSVDNIRVQVTKNANINAQAIVNLINEQITTNEVQAAAINAQVNSLLRSNQIPSSCHGFRTCEACSLNNYCVWCTIEQVCVGGDLDGPLNKECSHYTTKGCALTCEEHLDCFGCLNSGCVWCDGSNECAEQRYSCPFKDYYTKGIVGKGICPRGSMNSKYFGAHGAYISQNPSESKEHNDVDSKISKLREHLGEVELSIQHLINTRSEYEGLLG